MPTLNGTMPYETGPELACVWCSQPTDMRFTPAGRRELGPQPLHITCGIQLIRAYEAFLAGRFLGPVQQQRLARLTAAHPNSSSPRSS